jgi:hypothetical protein
LGTTLAWSLHPDSSLRSTAQEAWDLLLPSLLNSGKHKSGKSRRAARV